MTAPEPAGPAPLSLPELQPLVAMPDDVRRFGHERRAGVAEVTPAGRLRLDSIARWIQDVAWADAEDAGTRELSVWLVRRTRVRVTRFPRLDERCRVTTYITGLGRMWSERRTDIRADGAERDDVEVSSIWVRIDPERRLPAPVLQVEIDTWGGPSTREVKARLRHPAAPAGTRASRWTLRASELDIFGHINNAAYFTALDEELHALGAPGVEPDGVDVEIEYRTPAQAGDAELRASGPMRWIAGAGGVVHASAALAGWPGDRFSLGS